MINLRVNWHEEGCFSPAGIYFSTLQSMPVVRTSNKYHIRLHEGKATKQKGKLSQKRERQLQLHEKIVTVQLQRTIQLASDLHNHAVIVITACISHQHYIGVNYHRWLGAQRPSVASLQRWKEPWLRFVATLRVSSHLFQSQYITMLSSGE